VEKEGGEEGWEEERKIGAKVGPPVKISLKRHLAWHIQTKSGRPEPEA